ncbi:hypothetical protein SARC_14927 [Sphaeroforma arctica JP610]|uniref:Uncharacterized protein n=1 Tax=Sphaeroforma arctica JP610 TaxID=667725 RepID=A0A0L0F723_9EUKA|nr:hypothetical protein SARC_14927 [Sphaeroforma arctica JP610]KNC72515.1 hypothetical protein SARC_14927 [Sphaeroforma arctica JP610]|eukprot:XP_014146417.1 hypothetical protein SARC_14927 [Sphaeroforma arctica JP610]
MDTEELLRILNPDIQEADFTIRNEQTDPVSKKNQAKRYDRRNRRQATRLHQTGKEAASE